MKTRYYKYYKVKREFDGKKIFLSGKQNYWLELIGNELITLYFAHKHNIPTKYFDLVKVPASSIYVAFGARFSIEYPFSDGAPE